jgi:cytochrome c553
MRTMICAAAFVFMAAAAMAADNPDWAYPVAPQGAPPANPQQVFEVPGSTKKYTIQQINDAFNPPDWFPDSHPAMPQVVGQGIPPGVRACALCHLPSGDGHPESSAVAGLPAAYIVRQMTEFANGRRKGIRAATMVGIGKAISEADTKAAADYFASLKVTPGFTKVVESAVVVKSYVGDGGMRFETAGGGTEPIGSRIIELPVDETAARVRDPRKGFVAHVPPGSLAAGQTLATSGGGKTVPCAICHGQGLKGLGDVPGLAGRSPMYLFRQLNDIKTGNRSGDAVALMKPVVDKLTDDDMIALAGYAGSLAP